MIAPARRAAFNEASQELATVPARPDAWLIEPNVCRVRSRNPKHPDVTYDVTLGLDGTLLCCCPASFNYLACYHQERARKVFAMTTATSTALVPVKISPSMALMPTKDDIDLIDHTAAMAFKGSVTLPAELNTKEKVAAVMLYGLELGLRPMTALRHLYIVKGKVSPSAELMAGMLMGAEPDARLEVVEINDERCTMRLIRPSRHIDKTYTVTWDDIKKAGLAREANLQYPQDRMRYHSTKRLMRIYCPDVINAMDGPLLDQRVTETQEIRETPAPASALYNEGDEPATGEWRDTDGVSLDRIPAEDEILDTAPYAPADDDEAAVTAPVDDAPAPTATSLDSMRPLITAKVMDCKSTWPAKEYGDLYRELLAKYMPEGATKFETAALTEETAAACLAELRQRRGEPPV